MELKLILMFILEFSLMFSLMFLGMFLTSSGIQSLDCHYYDKCMGMKGFFEWRYDMNSYILMDFIFSGSGILLWLFAAIGLVSLCINIPNKNKNRRKENEM